MSNIKQNTTDLQLILETINNLPEANNGVELPELSNPASASDILSGKEGINENGEIVTGTIETFDGSYECSGESTGGGDSSSEAWTGTVYGYLGLGDAPDFVYYYTDATSIPQSVRLSSRESATITILANTYIIVYSGHSSMEWIEDSSYLRSDDIVTVFLPIQNNFEFYG